MHVCLLVINVVQCSVNNINWLYLCSLFKLKFDNNILFILSDYGLIIFRKRKNPIPNN